MRHYKEDTRFRLLFPEIPAGSVDEAAAVARRAGSPMRPGQAEDGPAVKTCPTHTEVYATKKRLRKAAPLKLKREFTGKKRRESQEGRLQKAGPTWALRNESVRAISEDGPYTGATSCATTKRARFIVALRKADDESAFGMRHGKGRAKA